MALKGINCTVNVLLNQENLKIQKNFYELFNRSSFLLTILMALKTIIWQLTVLLTQIKKINQIKKSSI